MRVHHQLPLLAVSFVGQCELNRLVVGVENQDEVVVHHRIAVEVHLGNIRTVEIHHHREGVRVLPVLHVHDGAGVVEPFDLRNHLGVVARLAPGEEATPMQHGVLQAQMNELGHEFQKTLAFLVEIPVRPGKLVVLTVGVVVAHLRASHLVAAADHRNTLADEQCGEQVAHLALTQLTDIANGRRPFHAAIPRTIVAFAVAVAFAVGLVVLVVVTHQVVHGEAVVRGDEIHRSDGAAPVDLIQVGAAHQTRGELGQGRRLRAPEIAHGVAIPPVPFRPAGREAAHLIPAGTKVPRLGDELDAADHRILLDDIEEGGELVHLLELTRQRGGQVESKAVHMHLGDPIAQRIGDELQGVRRAHEQRIAGAGGVEIMALVVVDQTVVRPVVDAFEA